MINELEGRAPQRVIADVKLTCKEEFLLEDEGGEVVHREATEEGPKVNIYIRNNIDFNLIFLCTKITKYYLILYISVF